ncbi:NACHT domain-containing protein [[Kitasatospora] papulosa]|uniref:NACHT domain-containing protein n=1 Tax=[Kitasatospora] papulosa TaxID=1464011 RepID=UPI00362998CF
MGSIKDVDRKLLWVRSGNVCAFPNCQQELSVGVGEASDECHLLVLGEEAHIVAKEDDGPRGDSSVSIADRNSHLNLILLCPTHHTLIDKEKGKNFSVEQLLEMKQAHEEEVANRRATNPSSVDPFTRSEILLSDLAASRARILTRWIAVGVDPSIADSLTDDSSIGFCASFAEFHASNDFSVLVGDFGSGKSVALEREYQSHVMAAVDDHHKPVPVYLEARSLKGSVEEAIDRQLGRIPDRPSKVIVFVDGLDEAGFGSSVEIVDALRSWLYSKSGRKVVATSRPDSNLNARDCRDLPPLSDEKLENLLLKVGANKHLGWSQSEEIRESLHRPLFALIAADCSKFDSPLPQSRGSFLEALVERALERTARISDDLYPLLSRLGYLTVNSGGPVTASEVGGKDVTRQLLSTRLVVSRDKTLSFALPVLGQYFAGQHILDNGLREICTMSPRKRDQWRDSLVFAVSAGSWLAVSRLLEDLTRVDPGLAMWVVQEAVPSDGRNSSVPLPEALECALRIHTSLDSWLGTLDNLAAKLHLTDSLGRLDPIGVGVDPDRPNHLTIVHFKPQTYAWPDRAVELTERLDWNTREYKGMAVSSWHFSTIASNFSAWPWKLTLRRIGSKVEILLKRRAFDVSDNKALREERAWHLVRTLTNQTGFTHRPIERGKVLSAIDAIFERVPDFRRASIQGKVEVDPEELREFRSFCTSGGLSKDGDDRMHRPYPVTDIAPDQGTGHIASCYSDEALRALTLQVYKNALSIYESLASVYFSPLLRTLHLGGALPVAFNCKLSRVPEDRSRLGDEPMFSRAILPLPANADSQVTVDFVPDLFNEPEFGPSWHLHTMDRKRYRHLRPDSSNWSSPSISHETLEIYGDFPATALAYKWLWNDLKAIGLVRGNAPYWH